MFIRAAWYNQCWYSLATVCILLGSSISTVKANGAQCGCISPLNKTDVQYNKWFTLTISVRCEHRYVYWYTSGNPNHIADIFLKKGFDFMESEPPNDCDSDSSSSSMMKNMTLSFNMTVEVHQILHGVVAGISYAGARDNSTRPCFSLPPARYYIKEEPGMIDTVTVVNVHVMS